MGWNLSTFLLAIFAFPIHPIFVLSFPSSSQPTTGKPMDCIMSGWCCPRIASDLLHANIICDLGHSRLNIMVLNECSKRWMGENETYRHHSCASAPADSLGLKAPKATDPNLRYIRCYRCSNFRTPATPLSAHTVMWSVSSASRLQYSASWVKHRSTFNTFANNPIALQSTL